MVVTHSRPIKIIWMTSSSHHSSKKKKKKPVSPTNTAMNRCSVEEPVHVRPGERRAIVCGVEEEKEKVCDSPLTRLITDEEDSEELCCKFPAPRRRVCLTLSALYYGAAAPGDAHTLTRARADERARTTSCCCLCLLDSLCSGRHTVALNTS